MANLLRSISSRFPLFIIPAVLFCLLPGCGSDSAPGYSAVIAEGRAAALQVMNSTGASSISLALVDGGAVVWAETFGFADKTTKTAPTLDTMYNICSVSKMLATVATMKLVDQKLVSLDRPLTDYIPTFSMLSPEYPQVTVRMLLNHSTGFPGSDYRNAVSYSPLTFSYSAQVMDTLKTKRLKHTPGYLSVYCNDCFTVVEQLVSAVTGKSYVQFVQDEILTPLGMTHSRYSLDSFPEGSFGKRYDGDTALPQAFLNVYGSGGLYSTPTDIGKLAAMLMNGGELGNVRILTEASVAAMGVDQTLTSFNPVKSYALSYGLGWDTVVQPGLGAVGVTGWQKTGDFTLSGAVMLVAPTAKLAAVVMGVSGSFGSKNANVIAERILLAALKARGWIQAIPTPLSLSTRPEKTAADESLDAAVGTYGNKNSFLRVQRQSNTLSIARYDLRINGWADWRTGLRLRDDDRFSSDDDPSTCFAFITADGRRYLVIRSLGGYGHYQDDEMHAQQVAAPGALPAAWSARTGETWLLTNEHPDNADKWVYPLLRLPTVNNLLFAHTGGLQVVDPSLSNTRANMMLLIPQTLGGELDDVVIETRGGQDWVHYSGSYFYRPKDTVQALTNGTVSIGSEGLSEWRYLNATSTTKTITIIPASSSGSWRIYNSDFSTMQTGSGTQTVALSGDGYYLVFHTTATVIGL